LKFVVISNFKNSPLYSSMENQPNPALIQKGDPSRIPLFLIHDAGGTISHYYKLENIDRPVYTIYNPWLQSETRWEGGSMRFVIEYIKLIKSVVSSGEILVGGI
jgi:thioesterase domain-containing protein